METNTESDRDYTNGYQVGKRLADLYRGQIVPGYRLHAVTDNKPEDWVHGFWDGLEETTDEYCDA